METEVIPPVDEIENDILSSLSDEEKARCCQIAASLGMEHPRECLKDLREYLAHIAAAERLLTYNSSLREIVDAIRTGRGSGLERRIGYFPKSNHPGSPI